MVEVWEPRYRDRVVLVATRKVKYPLEIKITKGAYQGEYVVDEGDYKHDKMQTKSGDLLDMTCIPLDKLRRIDGKD